MSAPSYRPDTGWNRRYLTAGVIAVVAALALALGLVHHGAHATAADRPVAALQGGTDQAVATAPAGGAGAALEEAPPPNSRHLTQVQAAQGVLSTLQGNDSAQSQSGGTTDGTDSGTGTGQAQAVSGWGTAAQPAPSSATESTPSASPVVTASPSTGWARSGGAPADQSSVQVRAAATPATPIPAAHAPDPVIMWPVVGPITSYFGPSHPLGIDIGVNAGTPIRAAASGTIAYVGGDPCCSYGYRVDVDHGNGVLTRYGHMLYLPALRVGQPVHIGDIIGLVGSTGFSTGPHLHFEVRLNDAVVDPLLVLPREP